MPRPTTETARLTALLEKNLDVCKGDVYKRLLHETLAIWHKKAADRSIFSMTPKQIAEWACGLMSLGYLAGWIAAGGKVKE